MIAARRVQFRKGFTLIELLVVVAIIVVLIAVLLPSLAKARKQAMVTKCAANLRAVGMAIQVYANENQDRIPYVGDDRTQPWNGWYVMKALRTSLQNDFHVLFCPANYRIRYAPPPTGWLDAATEPGQLAWTNGALFRGYKTMMFESDNANIGITRATPVVYEASYSTWGDGRYVNHRGEMGRPEGANWLYIDWHVEWIRRDSINSGVKWSNYGD